MATGEDPKERNESWWAGIDVGAATTKAVIIDDLGAIRGRHVRKSGVNYASGSKTALRKALESAGLSGEEIRGIISTGYGRYNVPFAGEARTEIGCHMRGCYHHYPHAATIVDIGGQDAKIIHVNEGGRRTGFKMNRKCAAGTGAFLEEMALRLGLKLSRLDTLARKSTKRIRLGSYCTVFSSTEVLTLIRKGEKVEDIARGVFESIVQRITEMETLTGTVILSGGVIHHNPILAGIFSERLGREVMVPPHPELMGAFGAALYAMEALSE